MRVDKLFIVALVAVTGLSCLSGPALASQASKAPTSHNGPEIQTWKTSNGAKVVYVYAPQLPMLDVRIVFDAGSARDGDKPGVASMTNEMLAQGAGKWDTNQLAERFDDVGARYSNSAARDMAVVQLRSLTQQPLLQQALDSLQAVINQPRFDAAELERLRQQVQVGLENQQQSPEAMATKVFFKTLYAGHPYALPTIGTKESVSKLQVADLQAFYRRYYVGKNALVAIVGAVQQGDARKLAEKLVGGLPQGEHAAALPVPAGLQKAERIQLPHPSSQTHILVGQIGMKRGDKDYFALYVGNHILGGGGFGSRIVDEIREKRGLAYSSYSYFAPMRVEGPFIMGLQTRNEKRDEALSVLDKTLNKYIKQGPTRKELKHAKRNITGGFALRIDSNRDIVQYIAMIGFYGLPLDYLNNFNAKVEKVSVAQIKDAFSRRIHPNKLLTVMVGRE